MTDPNRASVSVEELRKLREATYEGEWYANFFRSPRGARSYWCVGVKGRGSQQVARAINSEREAEFIAYAANHALTLISQLEAERKELARLLAIYSHAYESGSSPGVFNIQATKDLLSRLKVARDAL